MIHYNTSAVFGTIQVHLSCIFVSKWHKTFLILFRFKMADQSKMAAVTSRGAGCLQLPMNEIQTDTFVKYYINYHLPFISK